MWPLLFAFRYGLCSHVTFPLDGKGNVVIFVFLSLQGLCSLFGFLRESRGWLAISVFLKTAGVGYEAISIFPETEGVVQPFCFHRDSRDFLHVIAGVMQPYLFSLRWHMLWSHFCFQCKHYTANFVFPKMARVP